jgi:hypothetical protein
LFVKSRRSRGRADVVSPALVLLVLVLPFVVVELLLLIAFLHMFALDWDNWWRRH